MALYARNKRPEFTPAPPGVQHAICVDVVDLGMVHSERYNVTQHKCELRWQSEHVMPKTGKPYLIVKRYTLSMNEKAALRQDVEAWLGRELSSEECEEFDVESLLDKVALLNIIHVQAKDNSGRTFGNIKSLMPPMSGAPVMKVNGYERVSAREGYKAPQYAEPSADEPPPPTDSEMGMPADDDIQF